MMCVFHFVELEQLDLPEWVIAVATELTTSSRYAWLFRKLLSRIENQPWIENLNLPGVRC